MERRRLSATEKGKSIRTEPYQAPRTARVKIQEQNNEELLQRHALTLIGRVTNPSTQKIWSVINFFTELWKSETRPVGADLGQGLFQFQFEREEDLLSVLEKRPYHFAKWMVIVQRWEPTTSPEFPSLLPFWIKVQGIPVHLWTEATIRSIGEDIGIFEEAEITKLSVRMRVQVNGRLPLIKKSTLEYPNGDEVVVNLVYERLEKHCSVCSKLDHEQRDCLEAKARKKALTAASEAKEMDSEQQRTNRIVPENTRRPEVFQFSSSEPQGGRKQHRYNSDRKYLEGSRREPSVHRYESNQRFQGNNRREFNVERYPSQEWSRREYHSRAQHSHQKIYREVRRNHPAVGSQLRDSVGSRQGGQKEITRQEDGVTSNLRHGTLERGAPLQSDHNPPTPPTQQQNNDDLPQAAIVEAMGEIRDVMAQYATCADPTENAARKERLRQAEEHGEIEETAIQMVRSSLATLPTEPSPGKSPETAERVPAKLRLGPASSMKLRLGPVLADETDPDMGTQTGKRKPGRPPGRKKVAGSPILLTGTSSRKRKVQSAKPPVCRRKLPTSKEDGPTKKRTTQAKSGAANAGTRTSSGTGNSENQPLCNFIPATSKRRKTDFQTPSLPGP
ncbi:hypothetical protein Bca101_016013 [Brassica carinata]